MYKRICATIIVIIIIVSGIIIYCSNNNEEEVKRIPEYESNLVCKSTNKEMLDEEEVTSTSIIYIYTDKDNITKIINQAISSNNNNYSMLESITEIYEPFEGIDATVESIGNKILLEVQYDFSLIDLDTVKRNLSPILSDDSIIMQTESLPIKLEDYLETLTSKYKCEEQ